MTHQLNWPSVKYFLKDYLLSLVYDPHRCWPYCCLGWTKWDSYADFWAGLKRLFLFGFVPYEISDLFDHLAPLILPRLKRFRKIVYSHPPDMTMEQWKGLLDHMIFSFQFVVDYRDDDIEDHFLRDEVEEGFQLFGTYFRHLWL